MPLTNANLVWRGAASVSSVTPASNGGKPQFTKTITTGVKNNIFPDVSQTERLAGKETLRKVFLHVTSAANEELSSALLYLKKQTNADDFVLFTAGTATDNQTDIPATPTWYGIGALFVDYVASTGTSLVLKVENYAEYKAAGVFANGSTLVIADNTNKALSTVTAVAYDDVESTITLTIAASIAQSFSATNTVVSTAMAVPSIKSSFSAPIVTSTAGVFSAINLSAHNEGTATAAIELTFTSATAYTVTADGAQVGTGNIYSDSIIKAPNTNLKWLTIKSSCFNTGFVQGDKVSFNTSASMVALWLKRVVPANSSVIASNSFSIGVDGESL